MRLPSVAGTFGGTCPKPAAFPVAVQSSMTKWPKGMAGEAAAGAQSFEAAIGDHRGPGRGDYDGYRGNVGTRLSVTSAIAEAIRAGKAGVRRVGESAIGIEHEVAMCGSRIEIREKRYRFRIGVVGEHTRCGDRERRVFRGGEFIGRGDGCGIGRRTGDAHVIEDQVDAIAGGEMSRKVSVVVALLAVKKRVCASQRMFPPFGPTTEIVRDKQVGRAIRRDLQKLVLSV